MIKDKIIFAGFHNVLFIQMRFYDLPVSNLMFFVLIWTFLIL